MISCIVFLFIALMLIVQLRSAQYRIPGKFSPGARSRAYRKLGGVARSLVP